MYENVFRLFMSLYVRIYIRMYIYSLVKLLYSIYALYLDLIITMQQMNVPTLQKLQYP